MCPGNLRGINAGDVRVDITKTTRDTLVCRVNVCTPLLTYVHLRAVHTQFLGPVMDIKGGTLTLLRILESSELGNAVQVVSIDSQLRIAYTLS